MHPGWRHLCACSDWLANGNKGWNKWSRVAWCSVIAGCQSRQKTSRYYEQRCFWRVLITPTTLEDSLGCTMSIGSVPQIILYPCDLRLNLSKWLRCFYFPMVPQTVTMTKENSNHISSCSLWNKRSNRKMVTILNCWEGWHCNALNMGCVPVRCVRSAIRGRGLMSPGDEYKGHALIWTRGSWALFSLVVWTGQ